MCIFVAQNNTILMLNRNLNLIKMKLKQLLLLSFCFITGIVSAQQMGSIPVNKNVRQGKLSNGLTYYILHNEWPEHVANFYIAQRVGSIQENDAQRGLAHFLEHMAFNGSEHFPDSTLLEFTRSLGVEFGSDLNAYTSIDQTVYRVCNVPTKRQTALDSCLLIMKDWSNGLTLSDKEIDKERGVIHQEWQLGSGPIMRIYERALPKMYPGSKYGYRLPIGLMSIVDNFPYKDLREYYKKWYRTDNQCIIVVGDVDVDHTEAQIKKLWANVTLPVNVAKVIDEQVPDNKEAIYVVDKDKELQFTLTGLFMKHDVFPDANKNDQSYYIDAYAKQIIASMLNQRLNDLSQKSDCPFTSANAGDGSYVLSKTKDAFQLEAQAKEGKDLEALAAIYREALRVRQFGFTVTEYDRAKAEFLSRIESEYLNRNKKTNDAYGDELRDHYLANEPIPSPEDDYQIMKSLVELPALNVNVINSYAKELISEKDSNFVAFLFEREVKGKKYVTETQMAQTIKKVRAEKLEAWVDDVKQEPLLDETKLPKAGKITKETENKQLGYKELTLSNGAKVILKKTDFKDNEILFEAYSNGGSSLYGDKDYVTLQLFDPYISTVGVGNFSNKELPKALAGKQVSMEVSLGLRTQTMSGSSVPKDLETMMQLAYLHFTDLRKDEAAFSATKTQLEQALKNKDLSPESVFSDSLVVTLFANNPRFAPLTAATLEKVSIDRVLEIWKERFAHPGQFTYMFVGNFDEATLRPLIEKYIACFPAAKKESYVYVDRFPNGKRVSKFTRKSETPKAIAFNFWKQEMANTLENDVMVDAAGQVLTMDYLKSIREDAGAAYSVSASGGLLREGNKFFAQIQAYCPMDPTKSDLAVKLLGEGIKNNTVKVDADKLQKVKDNMLKNADISAKSNGHWVHILQMFDIYGVDLQTNYKAVISSLTPAKVANFIKGIYEAGNYVEVVMTPAK